MSYYIAINKLNTSLLKEYDTRNYEVSARKLHLTKLVEDINYYRIEVRENSNTLKSVYITRSIGDDVATLFAKLNEACEGYCPIKGKTNDHLVFTANDNMEIQISTGLSSALGFTHNVFNGSSTTKGPIPKNVIPCHHFLITCDIIEAYEFNSTYENVISTQCNVDCYVAEDYHRIQRTAMNTIAIKFLNTNMERMPITDGTFTLVLHFRKRDQI